MRTLYVGGLDAGATEEKLRSAFSTFGELAAARVVLERNTAECRGFGYVTFAADQAALRAKSALDGQVIDGSRWRVALAD